MGLTISCLECEEKEGNDKTAVYVGQTSRSMFERGQEHLYGLRSRKETSPLFKHTLEEHDSDLEIRYEMKVIKKHFSSFSRLVHESVVIERTSKADNFSILNSRGEWERTHLPRLTIDVDSLNGSKETLVKNNNFSKTEEAWNMTETKKQKEMVKRKASSEENSVEDKKLVSNDNKNIAKFSFSSSDSKGFSKAAKKSNSNFGGQVQTDIYRFLATNPNFKSRKKLKLSE